MRWYFNPELRRFVDSEKVLTNSQMVSAVNEWVAGGRRTYSSSQLKGTRKPIECYMCGKPGHVAKECRSVGKPGEQNNNVSQSASPVVTKSERPFKCYGCGELEHKRPDCPNKAKRTKVVQSVPARVLGHNDVLAEVGGICIPATLDTGADVTLLPKELDCVKQLTGETTTVKGIGNETMKAPLAEVEFLVEGKKMSATAAMVPGEFLGWEGALAFSLDDEKMFEILCELNKRRQERYKDNSRLYIPVTVGSDREIKGAVLVSDLLDNDERKDELKEEPTKESTPKIAHVQQPTDIPAEPTTNADNAEVEGEEDDGWGGLMKVEGAWQKEDEEGIKEDSAGDTVAHDGDTPNPEKTNSSRDKMIQLTKGDETLRVARKLTNKDSNGFK